MRILVMLALLMPALSFAADPVAFHGKWKGKGTYILNGKMTQCSLMEMGFAGAPGKFEFSEGRRICDDHSETFGRVEMDYRDGEIFFYGQKVGEYTDNYMTTHYRAPEGDGTFRNWRMSMRVQGNHLMYEESRTMDGETTPKISFAGMLIREE